MTGPSGRKQREGRELGRGWKEKIRQAERGNELGFWAKRKEGKGFFLFI
jgi:hypothetical protein